MKRQYLAGVTIAFAIALFSYGEANGQVVDAVKDAASKTKKVTKKTAGAVKDGVTDAAEKTEDFTVDAAKTTGDVTADAAKKTASTSKKIGSYSVDVTENAVGDAYEGGKYYTVKTWDGTKWVSNRVWYKTKQAAGATKDFVVGDEKKP